MPIDRVFEKLAAERSRLMDWLIPVAQSSLGLSLGLVVGQVGSWRLPNGQGRA